MGPLERGARGLKVPGAKRVLAERGESSLVVWIDFENPSQKRVGFCVPAQLGCSDGGGLEGRDLRQLSGIVLPHCFLLQPGNLD